jgi:hypothetical protein
MDWMTAFEGVIDVAKRIITLMTPEKKRICFKSTFELKGSKVNYLKGVSLDEVPVVKEYPDVFPEELPGMPPDRGGPRVKMTWCPQYIIHNFYLKLGCHSQ